MIEDPLIWHSFRKVWVSRQIEIFEKGDYLNASFKKLYSTVFAYFWRRIFLHLSHLRMVRILYHQYLLPSPNLFRPLRIRNYLVVRRC